MKLSAVFLSTILLCGTLGANVPSLVEKGYDKCHHAVYGQIVPDIENGTIPVDSEKLFTVPLGKSVGPLRKITFNPQEYSFTIRHTGTYVMHYSVNVLGEVPETPSGPTFLLAGVSINDNETPENAVIIPMNETEFLAPNTLMGVAQGALLANLRKGDTVSLMAAVLGTDNPYIFNTEGIGGTYLTIHKAETNK